uniref:Uncharacterized protein n=1 Tax=Arundo donax TaxID=35708 RepID=A0A0A9FNU5_ARUDO
MSLILLCDCHRRLVDKQLPCAYRRMWICYQAMVTTSEHRVVIWYSLIFSCLVFDQIL